MRKKLLPIACCAMLLCSNVYATEENSTQGSMDDIIAQVYNMSLDELRTAYIKLYANYVAICDVYKVDTNNQLLPEELTSYGGDLNLTSSDIVTLQKNLTSGNFKAIYKTLKNAGCSNEILDKIQDVLDIQKNLYLSKDDFEDDCWYFPASNNYISESTHAVPYIYLGTGGLRIELGFRYKEWLFFERTKIKLDNGDIIDTKYDRYNDIKTDSKGDGILESADVSLSYDDLQAIANSKNITIRFLNRDNTYLEYTTSTEAFSNIKLVKDCYDLIKNIISPQD